MTLSETLAQANKAGRERIPAEALEVMDHATEKLVADHLADKAIALGSTFPTTTIPNAKGEEVDIQKHLAKGPVVISFYRGGWCPYCNIQLKALQDALPKIKELGASLIAITPETPDNSLTTSEKNHLTFEVLTDNDNTLAKKLGLVFHLDDDVKPIYDKFGIDIAKHNGNQAYELPMPATFVVNTDGKITYRFVNEDYTKRAEISDILDALKAAK